MAEPNGDGSVNLSTGLFTLGLKGGNALFFFLLLIMALQLGLTLWEHYQRHLEHEAIDCRSKLGIFIYTAPKGAPIEWERMPVDLYTCIPSFLYSRPAAPR